MRRTEGVLEREAGENSGQQAKHFCSVGTNSLCRGGSVISLEQGWQTLSPSCAEQAFPLGPRPTELGTGASSWSRLGPPCPPRSHRPRS